jgi:prepilin-type processing-associated H-X9-DG protein
LKPGERPALFPPYQNIGLVYAKKFGFGPGSPAQDYGTKARLPILIEHVGLHGDSAAHVAYMDGHVEYIPYPGKWPMTPKTVGLLQELENLHEPPHATD